MAVIDTKLKIKYGLSRDPTSMERQSWAALAQTLMAQGVTAERAGELAAAQLLPGFQTHVYASEADTIEMLLRGAKE